MQRIAIFTSEKPYVTFDNSSIESRDTRLSRSLSGTNLKRAGDYNMRTVLQAIRLNGETTRGALAQTTGLTAPTIANITNRLIELDLVRNPGRIRGARGQPALRLQVNSDGAFGIGLNIDRDHLTMVTMDLSGRVRSRLTREVAFAMPDDVSAFVHGELDRLLVDGGLDSNRVLGIGVALPDDLGRITLPHQPAGYERWTDVDPAALLSTLPWPIHSDNDAAAAALGEAEFGTAFENPSFFYILINAGLGGGPVIDRAYHRGTNARSGEIGLMPDTTGSRGAIIQDTVSLSALLARLEDSGEREPKLVDLMSKTREVTEVIEEWLTDAVRVLTAPLVAINCLLDLDAILIGGRLPMPLIARLAEGLSEALNAVPQPCRAKIMPAVMAQDAPAVGAAILPFLDHILPSDSILIQSGRR